MDNTSNVTTNGAGSATTSSATLALPTQTRPTMLESYVASSQPHERVALGIASQRPTGGQLVQQLDQAWQNASAGGANSSSAN